MSEEQSISSVVNETRQQEPWYRQFDRQRLEDDVHAQRARESSRRKPVIAGDYLRAHQKRIYNF